MAEDGPSTTVLAVDGRILADAVPAAVQDACARLSTLAETRILGMRFERDGAATRGWRLLDATPYPDLSSAGEYGIAAIEAALAA
jgi:hypothetical protein